MSERFLKTQRLLKSREFKKTLDSGRKLVSKDFVLFSARSDEPKMGLIVSRKVGNAVVRNKVKRTIREWYRKNSISERQIVVLARPASASKTSQHLTSELNDLGRKLQLS